MHRRKVLEDYSFNDLIREIAQSGNDRVIYEKTVILYAKADEKVRYNKQLISSPLLFSLFVFYVYFFLKVSAYMSIRIRII